MTAISLSHLRAHRDAGTKFSVVTAYDACFAEAASLLELTAAGR